jgi:hypothetical protein
MDLSETSEKHWEHDLSELSDMDAKDYFQKGTIIVTSQG